MEKGEAGRVALAVGVLIDWIARTDERLTKLEEAVTELTDSQLAWGKRIEALENKQENTDE